MCGNAPNKLHFRKYFMALINLGNLSVLRTLEGRGPLRVSGTKLVFVERSGMDVLVHDFSTKGFPLLGKLQVRSHNSSRNTSLAYAGKIMSYAR